MTQRRATMGWQLVREAEDHGPDGLTWRERFALSVLANAAMDSTRECPAGIEDRQELMARLRLGRSELYAILSALCQKGALVQLKRGGNGRASLYAVARMAPAPVDNTELHPGNPDPTHELRPGFASGEPGPYSRVASGNNGQLRPANPDATEGDTVLFRGDLKETRSTLAGAGAREAIRRTHPDLNDKEIEETIRVIQAKLRPNNIDRYVRRLIENDDLAAHIPCGLGDGRHSGRCRTRDCANCTSSWCQGRCHQCKTRSEAS